MTMTSAACLMEHCHIQVSKFQIIIIIIKNH